MESSRGPLPVDTGFIVHNERTYLELVKLFAELGNERQFSSCRRRNDRMQKYIFPGSELASVSEILRSLTRVTASSLYHAEDIDARTLAAWRERFHAALPAVRARGLDERFARMWNSYLAYCEPAFLERHTGSFPLPPIKNHYPKVR